MKLTYNWLKDFVEIKLSPQALADKLTMAGLEVKSLDEQNGDFVYEIEITSNRPDWLSVVGVAREVAAVTGKRFTGMPVSRFSRRTGAPAHRLTIRVENKKDCSLYTAKIIEGVKVGPSPDWLRQRLELIGCRSINNIVDITNYVLFETGEPLHAFDLDKIVSRSAGEPVCRLAITTRRAKENEEIITIDGIKRALNNDILIIAADTGSPAHRITGSPIAIAGVMGGKETEVTASTKNVLLEAAVFNPGLIRRGRQQLGLQTDSAYRFERGIGPEAAIPASWRAVELIRELSGGELKCARSVGAARLTRKAINLSIDRMQTLLGVKIDGTTAKRILEALGCKVAVRGRKSCSVVAAPGRLDIQSEVDLIEEVARVWGYEKIPVTIPTVKIQSMPNPQRCQISAAKTVLAGLGLDEAITYSLVSRELLDAFKISPELLVEVQNPLSSDQAVLRPTLIPSLAKAVAYNLAQKQPGVGFFEIGNAYSVDQDGCVQEQTIFALAVGGQRSWLTAQGAGRETLGLLHAKGIIQTLLTRLGVGQVEWVASENPQEYAIMRGKQRVGVLQNIPAKALAYLDVKHAGIVAAQLYLDALKGLIGLKKTFSDIPRYPAITRDISV